MSTTPSIQSSTRTPALARIGMASDPGLADTGLNDNFGTARTQSPSHELNDGQLRPLPPLSQEEGEDPLGMNAGPPDISKEEYAAESDEEVEGSDDDPPYSPGDRSPDEDEPPSRLLHFTYRRPLGVSTSTFSKNYVNDLDPNGGQCLLTRDLATETGVENAHLLPQAWNSQPKLLTRCEWALGQKYKSLHVDEPRNIVRIRRDWHWNYDQNMFLLMPSLKIIDAFEARRVVLEASPSNHPPDIMSLYGEEDVFEYRLVPLRKEITNIFRFKRDDEPISSTTSNAYHSSSRSNPIPPTTSDGDRTTSESDPSPPAVSVVNHHAVDSHVTASHLGPPDLRPQLSAQKSNCIADGDSPSSNTRHSYVDASTQTEPGLPTTETEIPTTQDSTSKMKLPAAGSKWSSHSYPFDTLPVLRSHALPHFVLINAGEKLSRLNLRDLAVAVAPIFKITEYQAMRSLMKLHKVYLSWVNAVVPSEFHSRAPPAASNDKKKKGKEQEQASIMVSGTLGDGASVDITDHLHAKTERNDGPTESNRSQRASDRQKKKEERTGHSITDALDAPEIQTPAPGSDPAGSGHPTEPSHSSIAESLPALDTNPAASSVVPTEPAETIAPAGAISLAVPAPVKPIEVPLYSQVAAEGKSVTSGKAPVGTSGQARRSIPTKIPTAIQTNAWNRADVGKPFRQEITQSGKLTASSSIPIQNTTTAQENSDWTTVRHRSPPARSKTRDSGRPSESLGRDSLPAKSRALGAGSIASQDNILTIAKRYQAVSGSHANDTGHTSGHLGKGKVSPRANVPHTRASAPLDVPGRVGGDPQSQRITRGLPASSRGLASADQDTRTTEHSSNHKFSKSRGEGAMEYPPEQKRRRVTRPLEGGAGLSSSRIPLPARSKRFIDRMKPNMMPSMSNRRVSFAQDQEENTPVASGSQGMTKRMPVNMTRTQDKDESTGDQRDSGSKHTDNNEQDGKGRKSSKSGKKRRYSRRSLGETI
ncbi:hypothetical protein HETIRDRAFT_322568 [Heterobasidion irregulare TC 32-1]|uniref:HNH nuclease domain-containing protein n=1 Tax=Heterobasidion irregulare (strain TC 32-1) TaxID=747525 RepID=W4K314_HETIT|nr:uncharacterized protein HETIRDRAFT_322568 [Heterobasidion irregulare TC 32-1]ETW79451.1 hypothetical protein HETIRDRAFT_322568 [Heterobasidion irregulare TC 32-1]